MTVTPGVKQQRSATPIFGRLALAGLVLAVISNTPAFAEDRSPAPAPGAAAAQQQAPQGPQQAQPQAQSQGQPQAPVAYQPGFLQQLRTWWDDSLTALHLQRDQNAPGGPAAAATEPSRDPLKSATAATEDAMKSAVEATKGAAASATTVMKNAVDATRDAASNAASAIVRLPNTRVVEVRESCARAANGAPDCTAAAAAGCRNKGFSDGKPLDVRSAEKCDTSSLKTGQLPRCFVETVVTRAVCQ